MARHDRVEQALRARRIGEQVDREEQRRDPVADDRRGSPPSSRAARRRRLTHEVVERHGADRFDERLRPPVLVEERDQLRALLGRVLDRCAGSCASSGGTIRAGSRPTTQRRRSRRPARARGRGRSRARSSQATSGSNVPTSTSATTITSTTFDSWIARYAPADDQRGSDSSVRGAISIRSVRGPSSTCRTMP